MTRRFVVTLVALACLMGASCRACMQREYDGNVRVVNFQHTGAGVGASDHEALKRGVQEGLEKAGFEAKHPCIWNVINARLLYSQGVFYGIDFELQAWCKPSGQSWNQKLEVRTSEFFGNRTDVTPKELYSKLPERVGLSLAHVDLPRKMP